MALLTAGLSKDPNTKVGAVVVSPDYRKFSVGYNGFAAGIEEKPEMWERPTKYLYAVHAEENAIINCPFDTQGCFIYITHRPCHRCMSRLVNAGIKQVYYHMDYRGAEQDEDVWLKVSKLFDTVQKI